MNYETVSVEVEKLFARFNTSSLKENTASIGELYSSACERLMNPSKGVFLREWDIMSNCLNGFRQNEFTILCGPTGSGKTMLLANIAAKLVAEGTRVHVAPVETGAEDFVHKLIGIHAGKEVSTANGETKEFIDSVTERFKDIFLSKKIMFSRYETRVSHDQLMCDIYNAHFTHGISVFLLDNLNFMMDVSSAKESVSEMDRVVHDLVVLCKLLPIHIVMVMHPKKTENGRVESEFDIKGSSTAVQEASNVILWNRLADGTKLPLEKDAYRSYMREMKFCKIRKNGKFVGQKVYFQREVTSENLREVIL